MENQHVVPIYMSIERPDYREIVDFVEHQLQSAVGVKKVSIILSHTISNVGELFHCGKPAFDFSRGHDGNWYEKLYLFSSYFYVLKGFKRLENNNLLAPNVAVFFNSSSFPESLLCEFFRAKNTVTYSLQHGMYLRPAKITYDIVNIANVTADNLLCWGDFSKSEVENFYLDNKLSRKFQCKVAGYPKPLVHLQQDKLVTDKVLVVLPRLIYKKESINLLELLIELEFRERLVVKLHPSLLHDKDIIGACERLGAIVPEGKLLDCLTGVQYFATVGFNTTSLFECLSNSRRILVYNSGSDEFDLNCFESFRNSEELKSLIALEGELQPSFDYFFSSLPDGYTNSILHNL
ncbi:hypothetical protein D3C77_265230 [compost metagenome]